MPADPLLLFGYIEEYPRNPFLTDGVTLCRLTDVDPRFGCWRDPSGEPFGGNTVGNALSSPDWPGTDSLDCGVASEGCGSFGPPRPSAVRGQPYYFLGDDDPQTNDWIPGEFAYRALSDCLMADFAGLACWSAHYILLAYGSPRTPGGDYLHCFGLMNPSAGEENKPTFFDSAITSPGQDTHGCAQRGREAFDPWALAENEPYPPLTKPRSEFALLPNVVFRNHPAHPGMRRNPQNPYGNPDGRPDGIILVFTSEKK